MIRSLTIRTSSLSAASTLTIIDKVGMRKAQQGQPFKVSLATRNPKFAHAPKPNPLGLALSRSLYQDATLLQGRLSRHLEMVNGQPRTSVIAARGGKWPCAAGPRGPDGVLGSKYILALASMRAWLQMMSLSSSPRLSVLTSSTTSTCKRKCIGLSISVVVTGLYGTHTEPHTGPYAGPYRDRIWAHNVFIPLSIGVTISFLERMIGG